MKVIRNGGIPTNMGDLNAVSKKLDSVYDYYKQEAEWGPIGAFASHVFPEYGLMCVQTETWIKVGAHQI